MVGEGEEGDAGAGDRVEEDAVAGIACGAFYGAGGGDGGERGDTPGDVCGVVGHAERAGVCGCDGGHVGGGGLEVVHDMDGEECAGREEPAEEEEEAGGVGAGRVGDGDDGRGDGGETAAEGGGELGGADRHGQHSPVEGVYQPAPVRPRRNNGDPREHIWHRVLPRRGRVRRPLRPPPRLVPLQDRRTPRLRLRHPHALLCRSARPSPSRPLLTRPSSRRRLHPPRTARPRPLRRRQPERVRRV